MSSGPGRLPWTQSPAHADRPDGPARGGTHLTDRRSPVPDLPPSEERSVAVEVAVDDSEVAAAVDLDRKLEDLRHGIADEGGVPLRSSDRRRYGARF